MNDKTTPKEALQQAMDCVGGASALARILALSGHQVVYQWGLNRVPAEYCPKLEKLTGVRCELLRPDVDWHVLRQPAVQATTAN